MRILSRYRVLFVVFVLAATVDLVSKAVVFDKLGVSNAEISASVDEGQDRLQRMQVALEEWERLAEDQQALYPQPPEPRLVLRLEDWHQVEFAEDRLYFSALLNPGAFGGMFGGQVVLLVLLSVLSVVVVLWLILRTPLVRYQLIGGFVVAGAVGNLYDRLMFGAVRDFVDFRWPETGIAMLNPWNTFNFADACIIGGILALLLLEIAFPVSAREAAALNGKVGPGDPDEDAVDRDVVEPEARPSSQAAS